MEAKYPYETSVDFQTTALCSIPKDNSLCNHVCKNIAGGSNTAVSSDPTEPVSGG
jgi:hypothetical protein